MLDFGRQLSRVEVIGSRLSIARTTTINDPY